MAFKNLQETHDIYLNNLANGGTLLGETRTIEETAKTVGILWGIDLILKMEYEEEE